MRWTSSAVNLSVAPMLKLTGGLLCCPLRHGGDRLHSSSGRLLAHRRFRCRACSRRLLFRETLLEGLDQINHGSHMRLRTCGYFLAFLLGSDHPLHTFFIFVAI